MTSRSRPAQSTRLRRRLGSTKISRPRCATISVSERVQVRWALAEVVLAILRSVKVRSGRLHERVPAVDDAITQMQSLVGPSSPPPTFDEGDFSGSVRELRRMFADDPAVTPGRIAAKLQESKAHQSYAGGSFVRASFATTGAQATIDEWCRRVRGLYDMEQVRSSSHHVIDGKLFLVGLAALDPSFDQDLVRTGVRDALLAEVSDVPMPPLRGPTSAGELEGGVSSELVDPDVGIGLDRDRLGVAPYVSMLASVICDRRTPMPLSNRCLRGVGLRQELLHGAAAQAHRRCEGQQGRHVLARRQADQLQRVALLRQQPLGEPRRRDLSPAPAGA